MSEVFKEYPELPLGLEYEFCETPTLCMQCGGIVVAGENMIRRSHYRNRAFEEEFAGRSGACLNCSKVKLCRIVTKWFDGASTAVTNYNDMDDANDPEQQPMMAALEESINQIQAFIGILSDFVATTEKEEVNYEQQPDPGSTESGA